MAFGMGCLGCAAARFETIEQGARAHGMDLVRLAFALHGISSFASKSTGTFTAVPAPLLTSSLCRGQSVRLNGW